MATKTTKRANQVEEGFIKADVNNLPIVDFSMVLDFMSKHVDNSFETRNWKLAQ